MATEKKPEAEPTPAEFAWSELVKDRGYEPSPHESFIAGFDSGEEYAYANPLPSQGPGGF